VCNFQCRYEVFEVGTEILNISRLPVSLKNFDCVNISSIKVAAKKWFKLKHCHIDWLKQSSEYLPNLCLFKLFKDAAKYSSIMLYCLWYEILTFKGNKKIVKFLFTVLYKNF
jgi:hypothetical protein